MTVSSAPKPRKSSGPMMWLGHNASLVYAPVAGIFVFDDILGRPQSGKFGFAADMVITLATLVFCAGLAAGLRHDFRLCEYCARDVPDDPEREVQRWRRVLIAHHSWALTIIMGAGLMVKTLVLINILVFRPAVLYYGIDSFIIALVGLYALTQPLHRRLAPWCPVCGWDDDDDDDDEDELEPEPDPDPAMAL